MTTLNECQNICLPMTRVCLPLQTNDLGIQSVSSTAGDVASCQKSMTAGSDY